jgi:hypothetical protein
VGFLAVGEKRETKPARHRDWRAKLRLLCSDPSRLKKRVLLKMITMITSNRLTGMPPSPSPLPAGFVRVPYQSRTPSPRLIQLLKQVQRGAYNIRVFKAATRDARGSSLLIVLFTQRALVKRTPDCFIPEIFPRKFSFANPFSNLHISNKSPKRRALTIV